MSNQQTHMASTPGLAILQLWIYSQTISKFKWSGYISKGNSVLKKVWPQDSLNALFREPFGEVHWLSPNPMIRLLSWTNCENLAKIHTFSEKLIDFSPQQTKVNRFLSTADKSFASLYAQMRFLCNEIYTFTLHFVHLFVKEILHDESVPQ